MGNRELPELCSDEICTGCMACANICPVSAIDVKQNEEGFYRPSISADKCIGCKKCEHTCPVINPPTRLEEANHVYAAWHKDDSIRNNSTSGGAFSAFAEVILNDNGIVVGAAYDDSLKIKHIVVEKKEDLYKLRLSKYAQSYISKDLYRTIKEELDTNRHVLFCGTPCQIAGLKAFVKKEYNNLILCDFICHGVPSPLMLEKYIDWLKYKFGKPINFLNFRDKRKGWYDALRVIKVSKLKEIVLKGQLDSYWIGFTRNNNLQFSCYHCNFLGTNRISDITIADFWGIGKTIPFGHKNQIKKGISMIMPNSNKGERLVFESNKTLNLFERSFTEIIISNMAIIQSSNLPQNRLSYYKDLKSINFELFIKKYLNPDTKTRIVKIMREYFPSWLTNIIRLINQK